MGNICCDLSRKQIIVTSQLGKKEEEKDDIEDNNLSINNINNNIIINDSNMKNNIIVFNINSKFNQKEETVNEKQRIKNKNTIKNINRRIYLDKKYKFADDKFEKHIKFTHFNKIISSTTNSFLNNK